MGKGRTNGRGSSGTVRKTSGGDAPKVVRKKPFTTEEKERIVDYVADFNRAELWDLLEQNDLTDDVKKSAPKKALKQFVLSAIADKTLSYEKLVAFLDHTQPWSRQHAFIYDGPKGVKEWKVRSHVEAELKRVGLLHALDNEIPLILPPSLTISSIQHDERRLRILAVRRREIRERDKEDDYFEQNDDGDQVVFKAWILSVARGLVMFDWDLESNTASMHITQLSGDDIDYDAIEKEFWDVTKSWLKEDLFRKVSLAKAIASLHREEEKAVSEKTDKRFHSHGIGYDIQKRRLSGSCAVQGEDLIIGDVVGTSDVINESLARARDEGGVGRSGNYYWHAAEGDTPFDKDVHFIIRGGSERRVNFPTDHDEETVRYVLARVREASKAK